MRRLSIGAVVLAVLAGAASPAASPLPRLEPAFNFALTTQQDDRLWLAQLRDRVVVLTFTCTSCEASCPGLLAALGELAGTLGDAAGRRVFFVAVTLDPHRDTPAVLRQFARRRHLEPPAWLFLTGRPAEIDLVARRYGVTVRQAGAALAHDCRVVLIDGAGVVRARYDGETRDRLSADVQALLGESSSH